MTEKEKLCVDCVNSFNYSSICDIYDVIDWLRRSDCLNQKGRELLETFKELFIEEVGEDEDQ